MFKIIKGELSAVEKVQIKISMKNFPIQEFEKNFKEVPFRSYAMNNERVKKKQICLLPIVERKTVLLPIKTDKKIHRTNAF